MFAAFLILGLTGPGALPAPCLTAGAGGRVAVPRSHSTCCPSPQHGPADLDHGKGCVPQPGLLREQPPPRGAGARPLGVPPGGLPLARPAPAGPLAGRRRSAAGRPARSPTPLHIRFCTWLT